MGYRYMRIKLALGIIFFVAGILLGVVSEIADLWILGFFAGILWPIGMILGTNALLFLKHEKQKELDKEPNTGDGSL